MFVDSHCHLNFPELKSQLPEILARMADAKVTRALCICTTLEEFDEVHALAQTHDNLWATVGVHPDNEGVREPSFAQLVTDAQHPRVVGIGETGLDYYRLNGRSIEDMAWQRIRYRTHIEAGRAVNLPLVIHTRSASEDTLAILKEVGLSQNRYTRLDWNICFNKNSGLLCGILNPQLRLTSQDKKNKNMILIHLFSVS